MSVAAVFCVVVGLALSTGKKEEQSEPVKTIQPAVASVSVEAKKFLPMQKQIAEVVAKKHTTDPESAKVPRELTGEIYANPDMAILCIIIEEARLWPGISADEEKSIVEIGIKNPGKAIGALQKCIEDGVTRQIKEKGFDPAKEGRWAWYRNNIATTLLFVDLPLARKLGKKAEFANRTLEGYRPGSSKEWYEPELSFAKYLPWLLEKKWPFDEGKPPTFQP